MSFVEEWFSDFCIRLIDDLALELMPRKDPQESYRLRDRYLLSAIALSEGKESSLNLGLAPSCREVLKALNYQTDAPLQVGIGTQTAPYWSYLLLVGWILDSEKNGKIAEAYQFTLLAGVLWGELGMKRLWGGAAKSGQKALDGSASTRIADDKERFAIVTQIIESEGVSQSKAFILAEERHRVLGSEASFKRSFFKHRKSLA